MKSKTPMQQLLNTLPQKGRLEWIGVRPARNEPMIDVDQAEVTIGNGITGDRFKGKANSKRQVTLIQQEHLPVIASLTQIDKVSASMLRRNLVVSGINLLALKDQTFQVGEVVLQFTGLCHPCSKMEKLLGPGGYNAMRGHGGITASVIKGGVIRLNDSVKVSTYNNH
ncbi:MOSC domain-containing protein [Pleionea mediterranea]|uniref:MOSC domain-containing protein YiiM n=1 Tax=Pleionea mediterranea TaxID=523701 RepID=A0A316FJH3_9GAMM|nr:MOSC domain-containing protein [Pleionea mediterranea]PWK47856.1 MOSC domain-containing protein YiiM [Pleionea mediterranea]